MNKQISEILVHIHKLEEQLEQELEKERLLYAVPLQQKVTKFEKDIIRRQRHFRMGLIQFFRESDIFTLLTAPIIYSLLIPIVLTDIWVSIYQHICFRVYGIPLAKRSDYIIVDRHHLAYLNWIEAMNCVFCGYASGIIAYAREIASRTEQHWCPIKHALRIHEPHKRYLKFLEYGAGKGYRTKLEQYRKSPK
jgi:hypothetical protein